MMNLSRRPSTRWSSKAPAVLFAVVFFCLSYGSTVGIFASAGNLDHSFGTGGAVLTTFTGSGFNFAQGVVVQPDGKILVAGLGFHAPSYRFTVVRYKLNGELDTAFGSNGHASLPAGSADSVAGIVLLPDGRIILGVTNLVNTGSDFRRRLALLRFTSNGVADTTFGTGGKVVFPALGPDGDSMSAIALQADGKIVIAGQTGNPSPSTIVTLRANGDGSLDSSFDGDGIVTTPVGPSGIDDYAADLKLQPDGKVVLVGTGWETGRDILLIRYKSDGSLDSDFGGDGIVTTRMFSQASNGHAIALQPDGKLVVAGEFISAFLVLRYNSDGTLDSTFDNEGYNYFSFGGTRAYPSSLIVQQNGKIVVAGYADQSNTTDDFALARLNPDGRLDKSFGNSGKVRTGFGDPQGIQDKVTALALQSDGKLIAVGEGGTYPPSFVVARYLTSYPGADYDADGRSDLSVHRPSNNIWYLLQSTVGYTGMAWGEAGDRLVPADYDGDGKTDVAVFRPSAGRWYIFMSQSQSFQMFDWGTPGDRPMPMDGDSDGKSDLVVYRESNNTWYTRGITSGPMSSTVFGVAGDRPVRGDFDADGVGDLAVFRPSDSTWYIQKSAVGFFARAWGQAGDVPVPADYDGDGATDIAIFRPTTGQWWRINSGSGGAGTFDVVTWGEAGDIPVPADYDGDGRSDTAVFRPSNGTWYIIGTTSGFIIRPFGQAGDMPTQSSFIY